MVGEAIRWARYSCCELRRSIKNVLAISGRNCLVNAEKQMESFLKGKLCYKSATFGVVSFRSIKWS